jgi:hypothetical protein
VFWKEGQGRRPGLGVGVSASLSGEEENGGRRSQSLAIEKMGFPGGLLGRRKGSEIEVSGPWLAVPSVRAKADL